VFGAGADMLFIEALTSDAEIEAAAETCSGTPLLFNWAEGGKTPPTGLGRLRELGFRLVIFPISTLLAATRGVRELLADVTEAGTPIRAVERLPGLEEYFDLIGLPEVLELGRRFEHG
jgi:2-methylisocitrate lyase-like PEP mutase family enzyme